MDESFAICLLDYWSGDDTPKGKVLYIATDTHTTGDKSITSTLTANNPLSNYVINRPLKKQKLVVGEKLKKAMDIYFLNKEIINKLRTSVEGQENYLAWDTHQRLKDESEINIREPIEPGCAGVSTSLQSTSNYKLDDFLKVGI